MCYNAARNNPYREHHHPQYTPLVKVDDDAIINAGVRLAEDRSAFMKKAAAPAELQTKVGSTYRSD